VGWEINPKSNIKSVGQECPTHTSTAWGESRFYP
jgi:hypothetical protein